MKIMKNMKKNMKKTMKNPSTDSLLVKKMEKKVSLLALTTQFENQTFLLKI